MIIATAGHVDHGKTLLVRALTGIETDRLEEERDRGLTIDLGFAYIDDEFGGRLGFIDVPGHIRFISNMLSGVGAIDFALLVVAADDGPMPQTIEHLAILDQLGITRGCIALTKIDRVEPSRIREVREQLSGLLAGTGLADAPVYPVSGLTGEGVDDLKAELCITAAEIDARATNGHFRLAIDRCFTIKGAGLVVTGSVFAGQIETGDEVYLVPQGISMRIRGIRTQDETATTARAGDRCALNLANHNLGRQDIRRGNWITSNPHHQSTRRFDVYLNVLATEARALRHWTPVHIHTAANHVTGRIAILESKNLPPGSAGLAQLLTREPINVCCGDRLILRDQSASRTIGGGRVLDPFSPTRGRDRPERIEYLQELSRAGAQQIPSVMLSFAPLGLATGDLAGAMNLRQEELEHILEELKPERFGGTIISSRHLSTLEASLISSFDSWHRENPHTPGLSANQVAKFLPGGCRITERIIERLIEAGEIQRTGNTLARPGTSTRLSGRTEGIWERVKPLLTENMTKPPVMHELAAQLSLAPREIEAALNECVQAGLLIRPVSNRYFLPEAISQLRGLLSRAADGEDFTVKQYRDVTGIGRNLCIEILEYFDRQGVTRRLGDKRKILDPSGS